MQKLAVILWLIRLIPYDMLFDLWTLVLYKLRIAYTKLGQEYIITHFFHKVLNPNFYHASPWNITRADNMS